MKHSRILESLTTRHLVTTVFVVTVVVISMSGVVLWFRWATLDQMAKYIDTVFKTTAFFAGVAWALNRYYVHRTDNVQFRIDADVKICKLSQTGSGAKNLLIYRLDIVNTGNTLFGNYKKAVLIESVAADAEDNIKMTTLHRWPEIGYHPGPDVEPGSWAAINEAVLIPSDAKAIRIFVDLQGQNDRSWTWHKTFPAISKD